MKLYGHELSEADLRTRIGSISQIGGLVPFRYEDGRGRDVRAVRLDTGAMQVEIVVDRCLDLAHVAVAGTPLMWRSANGIVAPQYYEPAGDAWLRSFFGGWMTTCGLTNFGPAGADEYGTFGLHGRIGNTPADELTATTHWSDTGCTFEVTGVMRETKALGQVIALYRTLTAELGGTTLHIRDRVVNEGSKTTPHMLLYHCNAGWPLLDETTTVHVTHSSFSARDAAAEQGLALWNRGGLPSNRFDEQVFIHAVQACPDGKARAAIVNDAAPAGAIGFEAAFDPNTLPALITWRMLESGNYVMAIEPANTPAIQGREFAGKHGLLPLLEPGETRCYELDLIVLTGERVNAAVAMIASATATKATP